jgi:lauroyl/myristoyl acyltransferase
MADVEAMSETGRDAVETSPAAESLWRLRWRLRMAIVRGRLDMHKRNRKSVRAAIERRLPHQNPRKIERRFLEYRRRRSLINRWLAQGMPHARRVVRVEGLSHLEEALSAGAGAILASAHFGHARLIKPVLGVHGQSARLVGALETSDRWPSIAAEDLPATLNLRPHLAALEANQPLIILVDGRIASSLTHIPVRGIGVGFAPGAMRIARAAGAPVLPTFLVDEGTLRDPLAIRLVIHPPLVLQSSSDTVADVREDLTRFAAVYAGELDRNPHNIYWGWVRPDSGDWSPPEDRELWELDQERGPDGADGSTWMSPAHGR